MGSRPALNIRVFDENPIHTLWFEVILQAMDSVEVTVCKSLDDAGSLLGSPALFLINMDVDKKCSRRLLLHILAQFSDGYVLAYSSLGLTADGTALRKYRDRVFSLTLDTVVQNLNTYVGALLKGDSFPEHTKGIGHVEHAELIFQIERLSPREHEVLCLLGKGHGIPEIGDVLLCQPETVKSHLKGIRRKTGLGGIMELRYLATRYAQTAYCRVFSVESTHICSCTGQSVGLCPLKTEHSI